MTPKKAGAKGGKAGTGQAKVRGDSDYYRRLVKLRWDNRQKVLTEQAKGA